MRALRAACALMLVVAGSAHAAQAGADGDALPISISATPATVWVGRPVTLAGNSVSTPTLDTITLNVRPTAGNSPAAVEFKLALDGGGDFSQSYSPSAPGTYEVLATAADGRGHARTSFEVQNPASASASTVGAIAQAAADAAAIVQQIKSQLLPLPANPAKDDLLQGIDELDQPMQQLLAQANQASKPLADLLQISSGLKLNDQLLAERDALLAELAAAEQAREHTKAVLNDIKNHRTTCDDLEVVVEGFKWTGVLLNFAVAKPSGAAMNFLRDLGAAVASQGAQMLGGGEGAQFGTSELVKSQGLFSKISYVADSLRDVGGRAHFEKLSLDANTIVSRVNDLAGQKAVQTMNKYCVIISGPVKAHMHAQFFHNGAKWWEYSFDLIARLTLHYQRDATGDQIPANGRLEGYGTNFKLWENSLTVQFPELMSSTVKKKVVLPPLSLPATASGALPLQYSSEGSVFSSLATPNAFFFQAAGLVAKDRLQLTIGDVRTDQSPSARVVVIMVPVLTAGIPIVVSYPLPYKDAHFVFERTSNNLFEIPLTTAGKVIRGQKHFENQRETADTKGEYSVDIQVCNPGC